MTDAASAEDRGEADRLLGVYLRDHFAGSTAGLALVRRTRRNNAGTEWDDLLGPIEAEIAEDRRALQALMSRIGVAPSRVKTALGALAEMVGRLKSNGRLFRYSPSSRVVELEGLAAGIFTKRNLWRALRAAGAARAATSESELERLIERATSQYHRVLDAHGRAATEAFAAGTKPGDSPSQG